MRLPLSSFDHDDGGLYSRVCEWNTEKIPLHTSECYNLVRRWHLFWLGTMCTWRTTLKTASFWFHSKHLCRTRQMHIGNARVEHDRQLKRNQCNTEKGNGKSEKAWESEDAFEYSTTSRMKREHTLTIHHLIIKQHNWDVSHYRLSGKVIDIRLTDK